MDLIRTHLDKSLITVEYPKQYTLPPGVTSYCCEHLYDQIPTISEVDKQLDKTKKLFTRFYKFQSYEITELEHQNGIKLSITALFYGFNEAINAIEGELNYQHSIVSDNEYNPIASVAEEILMMEEYLQKARTSFTSNTGDKAALDQLRKVTAMGIRAMINHGSVERKNPYR